MGNELQKELEKMNTEIARHEDYLKSEKTTYGLADLINGKIPSKQLPSEINLTANTLDDMNALIASGAVNDGQLCYLKEDKKLYVLKDGKWEEVGGGGIPVVEGTTSATTTDGAYATYTIPEAQTSCFIFKCDLGMAFISYNNVFGTYNGYLDAHGDATDGSLKLGSLIVLSGSGTKIDIFFGNIGGSGGSSSNIVTIEVTSMPETQIAIDVSAITNDTQFVNIKETSTNKNYLLYRVGDDFASCYSNEFAQGKIVAYYYIDTQQKQLYYFVSSVGKLGKIFGNYDIQVPAASTTSILPCTASDNGKVLSVVNGEAQWASAGGSGSVTVTFED